MIVGRHGEHVPHALLVLLQHGLHAIECGMAGVGARIGPLPPAHERRHVHAGLTADTADRQVDDGGTVLDCLDAILDLHLRK